MESFGAFIKAEREKKGISLKEISNVTQISHHVLEALESDHIEEFPYPAYAKGFLHTYAKQLGLNSNEVVSRYVDFVSHTHSIDKNRVIFDDMKQLGRVSFDQNKILTRAERLQGKRIIPAFLIVSIIVGVWLAWSIFLKQTSLSMNDTSQSSFITQKIERLHAGLPEIKKEAVLSSSETEETMIHSSGGEKSQESFSGIKKATIDSSDIEDSLMNVPKIEKSLMDAQASEKTGNRRNRNEKPYNLEDQVKDTISSESSYEPLLTTIADAKILSDETYQNLGPKTKKELIINAIEQTWIDIEIDATPPYDFILYPGDVIKLEAQTKFSLLIGNAGGIILTYEGETLDPLGESEEVVRLNLPR